jgi:hypothetical protein
VVICFGDWFLSLGVGFVGRAWTHLRRSVRLFLMEVVSNGGSLGRVHLVHRRQGPTRGGASVRRMLRQPGASGQTEGPAPCSTDGDLDARSDALSVRDQGTLSPDALSVRDQGTLSPNQLSMVALRIEKSYSIVSYAPARTKVSITGREGPVLQRFSQRSVLQGGGAVLQRFSQRSLLITGMGGPVSRRFPRPARLCVVLGAIVRVLVGGGPLCVVLGATCC